MICELPVLEPNYSAITNLQSHQTDIKSDGYPNFVCSQGLSTTLDKNNHILASACVAGIGQGGVSHHINSHAVQQTQGSTGGFCDMGMGYGHFSQVSPLTHHISSSPMLGT